MVQRAQPPVGRCSALGSRILRNRWLQGGLTLAMRLQAMRLQAMVLYAPPMNALFHTVPLPLESLLPLMGVASVVLWGEEARKLWLRMANRARA